MNIKCIIDTLPIYEIILNIFLKFYTLAVISFLLSKNEMLAGELVKEKSRKEKYLIIKIISILRQNGNLWELTTF